MSKRWILRLVLSIMLLAALSAAVCATDEENWYDAEQQEYFWEEEQLETVFPDVAPGSWYYDDVMYLYRNGVIGGFPDGTFRPNAEITRAEVMEIINNVLFRTPDKDHFLDDMVKWPDNSNPNAWYYEPVQEATNSHDYERVSNTSPETWTKITQQRDWDALEAELAQKYPNR